MKTKVDKFKIHFCPRLRAVHSSFSGMTVKMPCVLNHFNLIQCGCNDNLITKKKKTKTTSTTSQVFGMAKRKRKQRLVSFYRDSFKGKHAQRTMNHNNNNLLAIKITLGMRSLLTGWNTMPKQNKSYWLGLASPLWSLMDQNESLALFATLHRNEFAIAQYPGSYRQLNANRFLCIPPKRFGCCR